MWELIKTFILSYFTRFTFTFTTAVLSRKGLSSYKKTYDAKLPKLYQIRGRADVQYSGRAQRPLIQEKRMFSSSVIWYSLLLRYTSLQTYWLLMKEFPYPFLSLLTKITKGQLGVVKYAKSWKLQGMISKDVVLMFDEM